MPIINHWWSSAPSHGTVKPLTLEDRFRYDQVIANKKAKRELQQNLKWLEQLDLDYVIANKKAKRELQQNLKWLEQLDLDYVASQYKVYNYLTDTHSEDQAAIGNYINNMPSWDRIWWSKNTLLGNRIFEAKIGDYEGRQSVIDFAQDKACQDLKQNNPDLWNQYFYERAWSGAHDGSNNRWVPKLRLFQDKNWKAYKNIKENFAKQEHIPQEIKAIVTPYLEQMWVVADDKDQAYYNAVGTHILKISWYNPTNNDHMRRAMKAGAAMKEFYGDWMTDSIDKDGCRRVAGVGDDGAWRHGGWLDDDYFGLVLWD